MKEEDIFNEIIYKNWCQIIPDTKDASSIKAFYSDVKRLYDINPEKNKNLKGRKYVFTEGNEFASPDSIVYNTKMSDNAIDYKSLGNAIRVIFKKEIPNKSTATILEEDPFGLPNDNICDLEPCGTEGVALEDIKNLLRFCVSNNETFFKMFVIRFKDNAYYIDNRREEGYSQVYPGDSRTESFIKAYCDDTMITLPKSLVEYKNSDGILSGESLHSAILHSIDDIDAHKEELIDVLRYDARKEFILELSKIRVDLNEDSTTDSYSFKILDLASRVLKENDDIEDFWHKLIIEKDGQSFTHDQIPQSIADSFKISGAKKKFDMAQILPDENQNGALLIELVDKYSNIGIQKTKLNSLFGISDEVDIDNLYNTLIDNYHTLRNSQQLAFVLAYCSLEDIELPEYNLIAADKTEQSGQSQFLVQKYDFIPEPYILSKQYRDLKEYIDLPYRGNLYIDSPYINEDGEFVCPGLNTKENDETDYIKVISLLNYLKKLYKSGKGKFKEVDWSGINEELGFNANESVYPAKYATEDEQLPESVENWAEEYLDNKELLRAMGVLTDEDIVIRFRMYLTDGLSQFDPHSPYSIEDEATLETSLKWLSDKPIFPLSQEKYDALKIAIEQINELRSYSDIEIEEQYDFDELYNNSIEYSDQGYKKWKENTGLHIYLYDGPLPSIIKINEYIDSIVFKNKDGNITDDGERTIYVNSKVDIQTAMLSLANSNDISLTKEKVYELFNHSIVDLKSKVHQLEEEKKRLKEENERLKTGLPSLSGDIQMSARGSSGVDEYDRPEWNEIARKKVKQKLEAEGFKFTQGIGSFSDICGVSAPDGTLVPLIVKSCRVRRLLINPIEWETLLKPNAMLWIFDGNDVMPLHLRALIRNQDKLVLEMDTRNLDDISRISEFARILKYFKQVHFDFNSVRPTTIAASYKEYAFDDRPMDEKPEEDDFE